MEFDLNYAELLICGKKHRSLSFRTSIYYVGFTVYINPKHLLCC